MQSAKMTGKMLTTYTVRYTKIPSGYIGQLIEWPEVITEGSTIEECREMLEDAAREMVLAYHEEGKDVPMEKTLIESMLVEVQ